MSSDLFNVFALLLIMVYKSISIPTYFFFFNLIVYEFPFWTQMNADYKDFKYKELIELLSADTRAPRLADSHGGQVG